MLLGSGRCQCVSGPAGLLKPLRIELSMHFNAQMKVVPCCYVLLLVSFIDGRVFGLDILCYYIVVLFAIFPPHIPPLPPGLYRIADQVLKHELCGSVDSGEFCGAPLWLEGR